LLGAAPRSYQVTPDIPTGDERHNKRKSGHPADSLKESQLAAGPDLLLGIGHHQRTESQQQASKRKRVGLSADCCLAREAAFRIKSCCGQFAGSAEEALSAVAARLLGREREFGAASALSQGEFVPVARGR
jgi:hypothetical protein